LTAPSFSPGRRSSAAPLTGVGRPAGDPPLAGEPPARTRDWIAFSFRFRDPIAFNFSVKGPIAFSFLSRDLIVFFLVCLRAFV
jgi:hypothetical protein